MVLPKLYIEEGSVDAKLASTFGISRAQLVSVVREVVAARADAVEDDPLSAAGQFAYIYGTRNLRAVLRRAGWLRYRRDNMELAKHPERELMVAYQSVDLACSEHHTPMAVSGKGAGAARVIEESALLFNEEEMGVQRATAEVATGMWFFCVSVSEDDVRAELSLSDGIENGNFRPFVERIFVMKKGDWEKLRSQGITAEDGPVELKPQIARK